VISSSKILLIGSDSTKIKINLYVKQRKGKNYQYSDNTFLKGEPTLEQYAEMKNIKNWYDEFLNQFSTKTEILQLIK